MLTIGPEGDHVRWIGKFEPTWREGKAAVVKEFGRNVEGRVFVLVHSEGDVGPNVRLPASHLKRCQLNPVGRKLTLHSAVGTLADV